MTTRTLRLEPADLQALQRELDDNLRSGGCFLPGATGLSEHDECTLELMHPVDGATIKLAARVVWVATGSERQGIGVTLLGFSAERRAEIERFIADHAGGPPRDVESRAQNPQSPQERLRHLSTTDQLKVARGADASERIMVERLYGKGVWPALISNPRLTVPEVARLARKANMPRPQVEQIVANGAWLQSPQVRRALLGNPRLNTELIVKVLRLMPKHELKLVPTQTTYPTAVRHTARRLFKI